MGNNNTTDLREEGNAANELPEKSPPGSLHEDDKIIENQLVSAGKVNGRHDVIESPGHTDVSDKISDRREQSEAPPELAAKGGQAEDDEKLKAIPAWSPRNDGNSPGDYVQVGKDEQFASTDLITKDFPEHETSLDSASDQKEALITIERSNHKPQESNLMENGKMQGTEYTSNVRADLTPETNFEHVEEAEEMGLENSEVTHLESTRMEEMTMRLKDMEFLDGDEGMLTVKKVTELDRDGPGPASEGEEGYTDGCRTGMSDEMKGMLASNELYHNQARPDDVLVLDHASTPGREEPKVSMEIATRGGQVEDYEEQRMIPTNSSTDYGNSPGCCVRVEMDDKFASTDPNTKDFPEHETPVNSASDLEEALIAMERLNDVPQELNVKDNGNKQDSRFSRDLTLDFDARTIPEPIKKAEEMELENGEVLHLEGNQMEEVADMEFPCADEGISAETKVTELNINVLTSVVEEGETDGRNGLFDQMNYVTTLLDVCPFQSENVGQCQDEAELVTVNSFEVNESSEASQSDGVDGQQEEEESTVNNILPDETEAIEAPFLEGDDAVDQEEAAERFIPSHDEETLNDEESQSSVSSSSAVPNSEATVSDFEFEKPRMDIPEIPGTSLVFMVEAKAPENSGEDRFPRSEISGILNGDSISNNIFPGMQKSPSFDLDIQSESDRTPLLFQDKAEIVIPTLQEQEKAVTSERSDSEKSKAPILRFTEREENAGEEANAASKPRKQESQGGKEKAVVRVKEKRSFGSLLFGNCICCGTDRLEYPSV